MFQLPMRHSLKFPRVLPPKKIYLLKPIIIQLMIKYIYRMHQQVRQKWRGTARAVQCEGTSRAAEVVHGCLHFDFDVAQLVVVVVDAQFDLCGCEFVFSGVKRVFFVNQSVGVEHILDRISLRGCILFCQLAQIRFCSEYCFK